MARLEWLRGRAFDAADAAPLTVEALAALPPDEWPAMRLEFHPSVHLLELAWNVPAIWQSVSAGEPLPELESCGETVPWAIWRRDLIVYWRSLSAAEYRALSAFLAGRDFAGVCRLLCDSHAESEVPALAAGLLRQWVGEGLIRGTSGAAKTQLGGSSV